VGGGDDGATLDDGRVVEVVGVALVGLVPVPHPTANASMAKPPTRQMAVLARDFTESSVLRFSRK
jgi:hypothetical protein